ncbi:hypothetical protein MesoLj113c_40610 [Mesorhizobium sp. 113-3-9]|uniref:hypothetical protein n=1 Tax=Mesorhizobium sp. 113-3-9 TaxID=2744517 RepID=UPI001926F22A|nr:hypothetical protein [Mesorhizobium sp. 113-3-9]BCG87951.1 hypothetical protein MesoLj113c_40610 [Mesorhizobium sp. 113-3-9]
MGGYKPWHDAIHDHQVECFASENGLTADLVWELILKHGNSRKAVIKAAQGLEGDVRQYGGSAPYSPVEPTPLLTTIGPMKATAGLHGRKPQVG